MELTRQYAGGLTLSVVYGYEVASNNDRFLNLAEECVDILANKISAGGGIVRWYLLLLQAADITTLLLVACVRRCSPSLMSTYSLFLTICSDIFPTLKHLPTWVPGSGFKIKAAQWKARMAE
jgi:hypothetical protein